MMSSGLPFISLILWKSLPEAGDCAESVTLRVLEHRGRFFRRRFRKGNHPVALTRVDSKGPEIASRTHAQKPDKWGYLVHDGLGPFICLPCYA